MSGFDVTFLQQNARKSPSLNRYYIYTPPPPLSPQGIGEGEGYTIVPSRSMQVLHTPRGYGGRLPHPVRGGLSSSSELLPARVITAIEAGHPIKHRVDL